MEPPGWLGKSSFQSEYEYQVDVEPVSNLKPGYAIPYVWYCIHTIPVCMQYVPAHRLLVGRGAEQALGRSRVGGTGLGLEERPWGLMGVGGGTVEGEARALPRECPVSPWEA